MITCRILGAFDLITEFFGAFDWWPKLGKISEEGRDLNDEFFFFFFFFSIASHGHFCVFHQDFLKHRILQNDRSCPFFSLSLS